MIRSPLFAVIGVFAMVVVLAVYLGGGHDAAVIVASICTLGGLVISFVDRHMRDGQIAKELKENTDLTKQVPRQVAKEAEKVAERVAETAEKAADKVAEQVEKAAEKAEKKQAAAVAEVIADKTSDTYQKAFKQGYEAGQAAMRRELEGKK